MVRGPMWWQGLSGLRLVIAIYGMLILLFSGGGALVQLIIGNPDWKIGLAIIFIGGSGFAVGYSLWRVAVKYPWRLRGKHARLDGLYDGLSLTRWFFVIFGLLIILFCGGCVMAFWLGGNRFWTLGLFLSVPVVLVGLSTWLLAVKVGRK